MDKTSLKQWKAEMSSNLEEFEAYWKARSGDPNFPAELKTGDWDEQFSAFCDMRQKRAKNT